MWNCAEARGQGGPVARLVWPSWQLLGARLENPPGFWILQEWTLFVGVPTVSFPTAWLPPPAGGWKQVLCKQESQVDERVQSGSGGCTEAWGTRTAAGGVLLLRTGVSILNEEHFLTKQGRNHSCLAQISCPQASGSKRMDFFCLLLGPGMVWTVSLAFGFRNFHVFEH